MKTSAFTSLLLIALALLACDDDEHTSNTPPDLRLEDVVGCWTIRGGGYCALKCFDDEWLQFYADYDSVTESRFESVGIFRLDHYSIIQKVVGRNDFEAITDTVEGVGQYKRVEKFLYRLDDRYQLATRYDPVPNLDSLPCGKPFTLLPKPANWTLF